MYAREPAVADCSVITFPTVPTAVKVVIVWIVKAVRFTVLFESVLKSANVFDPVMIQAKAFVVAFQKLLYVFHPHAKVTAAVRAPVNFIVEVFAFTVPVPVHNVPVVPVKRCVADPSVIAPDAPTLINPEEIT